MKGQWKPTEKKNPTDTGRNVPRKHPRVFSTTAHRFVSVRQAEPSRVRDGGVGAGRGGVGEGVGEGGGVEGLGAGAREGKTGEKRG